MELGRSRKRLSQSALELTSQDEEPAMTTGVASVAPQLTVATTSPLMARSGAGGGSGGGKSRLPAFLTPPLMRKRKHLHDANFSTSLPTSSPTKSAKSPGIFSFLKIKFDRNHRKSTSSLSTVDDVSAPPPPPPPPPPPTDGVGDVPRRPLEPRPELPSFNGVFNSKPATLKSGEEKVECTGSDDVKDAADDVFEECPLAPPAATPPTTPPLSLVPRLTRRGVSALGSSSRRKTTASGARQTATSAAAVESEMAPPPTAVTASSGIDPGASGLGPFRLHVFLRQGRDLAVKDTCGTSDPYVKFKQFNKMLHRSKTIYRDLNPTWDEEFDLAIDDLSTPLNVRVFDYDWGMHDDLIGSTVIDLTELELNKMKNMTLELYVDESDDIQGYIDLAASLYLKGDDDVSEQKNQNRQLNDQARKLKVQIWSSVVNILVIDGKRLAFKDGDPLSKPYLRLRLGNEKHKTKSAAWNSSCTLVTWLEQFDFHLFEDQTHQLEIHLCEKGIKGRDELVARATLDLTDLAGEVTHSLTCPFQNGGFGDVSLLVTISGTTASETISDLSATVPDDHQTNALRTRYVAYRTLENLRDVGHLSVKVYRATELASTDIGGKSDPFCVLQLDNSRLQTQTEYKTLNPNWNKIFTFNVKDINSVLEVTVYDEDRDHRVDFIGKVAIPLLRIRSGQKKWYVLKDRKLRSRAKGINPQILLELDINWNPYRASFNTLQPKEKKYIEPEKKFNRHTFVRNVMRIKSVVMDVIEMGKFIESCWEWDSTLRSSLAFIVFLLVTWYFEPFVLPLGLLLHFLRNFILRSLGNPSVKEYESDTTYVDEDDDDADDKTKEEKKSLKEKLQAVQEVTLTVQTAIGTLASLLESVKNTFNFSVPFLSYLAIALLVAGSILLYAIPLRYLIMGWGVNKFTRKLLRPHSIPNNELLDFMSRVPDDEQLADFREIRSETPVAEPVDRTLRRRK